MEQSAADSLTAIIRFFSSLHTLGVGVLIGIALVALFISEKHLEKKHKQARK